MASNADKTEENRTRSYRFSRFSLNVADNGGLALLSDGHAVGLTNGELTVLRVLLENRGQFVKTRDLLSCVSQSPRASENLVHGAVRELRRTLHDADLIKTERTKGYCFVGQVKVDEVLETSVHQSNSPEEIILHDTQSPFAMSSANQTGATTDRRRDTFLIVALLVSVAVLVLPFGLAFAAGSWTNVTKQLSFIQALMILVAIGYDLFLANTPRAKTTDMETQRALIAVQQFRRSWRLLLISWCCLYVTLLLSQELALSAGNPTSQWQALQV